MVEPEKRRTRKKSPEAPGRAEAPGASDVPAAPRPKRGATQAPRGRGKAKKAAPPPEPTDTTAPRDTDADLLETEAQLDATLEAAGEVVIRPADALQLVTFMLAGEEYGFPIMRVQEVLRRRHVHITPIPNAPSFVEGVMNLRGRVIPIVGLRRRFGMEDLPPGRAARVVVVEVSGRTLGVSVDAVVEVVTIDASRIEPLPELASTARSEFIVGVSRAGARIVIVLDMDRVFSSEERAAIEQIATAEREETSCA